MHLSQNWHIHYAHLSRNLHIHYVQIRSAFEKMLSQVEVINGDIVARCYPVKGAGLHGWCGVQKAPDHVDGEVGF